MPKLQITLPDGSQLDHEFTDEIVAIGRAGDNTIVIEDPSISGHHAQIVPGGDGFVLKDLASTNGSRINGKNCTADAEYQLSPGDKIRFGKIEAAFDPKNNLTSLELPPDEEHVAKIGKNSVKPSSFMNASPFEKKSDKKDPVTVLVFAFAAVAFLSLLASLFLVMKMSA